MDFKKDFPIFRNKPELVFLDSSSSSQKPQKVIDSIVDLYSNDYANIHRWVYDLSQKSEEIYQKSKEKVRELINADSTKEIIYTYNSTYAINLITSTLKKNNKLKSWDTVLLSISEHHANIVPWLILKDEIWINVEFINLDKNFDLDLEDFKNKYNDSVKVVSLTYVSNVLWNISDLKSISKLLRNETLFIIDGSQSVPHFKTDVKELNCDFMFFTGHKMLASTWIWVMYWKEELLKELKPSFSWWWAISLVETSNYKEASLPEKFEPGTPNIEWACSLLAAIEYIEEVWGYENIEIYENELVEYTLKKFSEMWEDIKLYWKNNAKNRVWVFSFSVPLVHHSDVSDFMAENHICIRSWKHCTEPLMSSIAEVWTNRMSLYLYNSKADIDKFFEVLKECIRTYK